MTFTKVQWNTLLRALHPDSSSPEYRHAAFILLKEYESELRPDESSERAGVEPLPTTIAELLQRKRDRIYANHVKRAAKRAAKAEASQRGQA
jgi:hypothetical protein